MRLIGQMVSPFTFFVECQKPRGELTHFAVPRVKGHCINGPNAEENVPGVVPNW